jgi:hypothetical protein
VCIFISPMRTTCPSHLIFLELVILIIIGEEFRMDDAALHHAVFFSLLIPFRTKYSERFVIRQPLILCFSLNMRDQDSLPHKITDRIILLFTLNPNTSPYMHRHSRIAPKKASELNSLCYFGGKSRSKVPPRLPPSDYICGNTNVPLSIIMKYAMPFCFHRVYKQFPGIFSCTNTVHQEFWMNK